METFTIGNRIFDLKKQGYFFGILNVTPDSFSDGGQYTTVSSALAQAQNLIEQGADVIDIGGESTRPGYQKISDEEEIRRIVPVIRAIKSRWDIPISVDTYKPAVARAALDAGCDMINDIWGLQYDPAMGELIASHQVPCVLMHNRTDMHYSDFLTDFCTDMAHILQTAASFGIAKEKILLDPGIGFAKTQEQNLLLLNHLSLLQPFGCGILLGTSRKSVIGLTLDLPKDQREEGTIATTVLGAIQGCHFYRVHNVLPNLRALRMTEAILNAEGSVSHE